MPKSINDIVKKWRKNEVARGGRSLTVWLYPKSVEMLNDLKNHYPRKQERRNVNVIARAIEKLYEDIFEKRK